MKKAMNMTSRPSVEVISTTQKEEKKINWNKVDLSIERSGTKIILPSDPGHMSIDDGIDTLQKIKASEEAEYNINEEIPGHFYDGLVAFSRALKEKYGFVQAVPTPGFFGSKPPQMINVYTGTGSDDYLPVPFGQFKIPGVEGVIRTGATDKNGVPILVVSGTIKKKHSHIVHDIVTLAKWFSKNESIYRSRAVVLARDEESDDLDFSSQLPFFDPHAGNEVAIFTKDVEDLINVSIVTPIRKTSECIRAGVPIRRGILLEGPYGTGKTLTARMTARACIESGWTFVHCTSASAFRYALQFARNYQPAVVFAEDIDHLVKDRGDKANDLINEIDGVVGKTDQIMVVFTTNFAEKIDKALLRPGRLDTVISLRPPKADAVERLLRHYSGGTIADTEDLAEISERIAETGAIPASIREIVERSKLAMIHHSRDRVTAYDLGIMLDGMKNHNDLIARATEGKDYIPDFERSMATLIDKTVEKTVRKILGR